MSKISYRFELCPSTPQQQKFIAFAGQCRFVFNELLARAKKQEYSCFSCNATRSDVKSAPAGNIRKIPGGML